MYLSVDSMYNKDTLLPFTFACVQRLIFFLLVLLNFPTSAQDTTAYYIRYPDRLQVNLFQSQKQYYLIISPAGLFDSKDGKSLVHRYAVQARTVSGFDLAYDKLSLSLTFKSVSQDEKILGRTKYFTVSNAFGDKNYIVESGFRRYKSFYDTNSPAYNSKYTPPNPLFINADLRAVTLKSKAIFFSNADRFSYRSSYSLNYRQLKTAASFLLAAGIQYNNWKSSKLLAPDIANYYGSNETLYKISTYSILSGAGGSVNLVLFKRFFFNATGLLTPELQTRYYFLENQRKRATFFSASLDTRFAFGINTKHFVYSINSLNDWTLYNGNRLDITNAHISASLNIGFRINMRGFAPLDKLKQNKYYQML